MVDFKAVYSALFITQRLQYQCRSQFDLAKKIMETILNEK